MRVVASSAVPNLLRSQLVLNDQDGELIFPVVKNGRPGTIMVPIPMSEPDVKAVAVYLHALQADRQPDRRTAAAPSRSR